MELGNVRQIVCREAAFFKNPAIDDGAKRKRLNLLFVKDLLDGVNGMILDHKDRRDNERRGQVEGWKKVSACVVLSASSLGMLYYVYLFAMLQSSSRQHAWFNSFLVWFVTEVLVISTALVLVEHVVVPLWSMKEVQRVKEKIVSDILVFQKKVKAGKGKPPQGKAEKMDSELWTSEEKEKEREALDGKARSLRLKTSASIGQLSNSTSTELDSDPLSFNAAEFLFPSYRIAQLFPEHAESELILRYKTPWPKKSFKGAEKSMRRRYDKRFEFIPKTIGRVGVFMLSNLVQLPPSLQDMGLQMVLLAACGYVLRLHVLLFEINPVLAFAPVALVVTVVHLFFFSGRKVRNVTAASTHPLVEDEAEAEAGEVSQEGHGRDDRPPPPAPQHPPADLEERWDDGDCSPSEDESFVEGLSFLSFSSSSSSRSSDDILIVAVRDSRLLSSSSGSVSRLGSDEDLSEDTPASPHQRLRPMEAVEGEDEWREGGGGLGEREGGREEVVAVERQ